MLGALLLAAAAPLAERDLVEVADLSGLAASPDGRWLAFRIERPSVARNQVDLAWAVVPSEGGAAPRVVADGGVGVANGAGVLVDERPVWRADSEGFVVRARLNGESGLWLVHRDGKPAQRLTGSDAEVTHVVPSSDGTALLADVAPVATATAAQERTLRDGGIRLDYRVDLSIGALGGFDAGAGVESVRMTGDWFTRGPLLPPARTVAVHLSDGGALAVPSAAILTGAVQDAACRAIGCVGATLSTIVPIPGQSAWVVTRTDRALDQQLYVVADGRSRRLAGGVGLLSGSRAEGSPCAVSAAAVFCVAASAGAPPRLVRIGLANGEMRDLYAPNAMLAQRLTGRIERLRWEDKRGRAFSGWLVRPPATAAARPVPVVLQYYRCAGFLRGGVGDELPYQLLAADGIAGLCINRAPEGTLPDRREDYRTGTAAIRVILARLARDRVIDPSRVGMEGLSFGSEVTMWVLRRSRLLRAAAIATGQIEASTFWYGNMPGRNVPETLRTVYGLGTPNKPASRWRDMAPASDAASIGAPLLLQLPETEARWSVELISRLARAGRPVDAYVFPDAAHIKFLPRQKVAAYARNRAWFRWWLGDEAAALTMTAAFDRWTRDAARPAAAE